MTLLSPCRCPRRRRFRFVEHVLVLGLTLAAIAASGCNRTSPRANVEGSQAHASVVRASGVKATEPVQTESAEARQSVEDRTVLAVSRAVRKHQLTPLADDCLGYQFDAEDGKTYYTVEVRENHHLAKCGGDPQTAPRLLTVRVMKEGGSMMADSVAHPGEFKRLDP